jgi:hypothetical protein
MIKLPLNYKKNLTDIKFSANHLTYQDETIY